MALLTIAGRTFDIAPFKLGSLKRAAPLIDRINAANAARFDGAKARVEAKIKAGEILAEAAAAALNKELAKEAEDAGLSGLFDSIDELLGVLAIGTSKVDPDCDLEWLQDNAGFADQPAIMAAFRDVLAEAGLAPKGEATAPARKARARAGA